MTRLLSTGSPALTGNFAATPAEPEHTTRELGDVNSTRKQIFGNALHAASTLPVYTNTKHSLQLVEPHYAGPEEYSLAEQKHAILDGRTLGRRLRGTWQLLDNATGGVLDQKKTTIANIPYMTHRGTFIHNGNEITLSNQLRLRPGIFTRIKENGEIEAHINVMPGKGRSHRYNLDPARGVFYANIDQAHIPLLPLLRAAGADDKMLRDAWGSELFATNMKNDNPAMLRKYYERLLRKADLELDEPGKKEALLKTVHNMELDPEVTGRTLGQPYHRLSLEAMLHTTKKLLAVSRGEAEVDDRDHLAYQTVHGPEDLIAERLAKDYGGTRRRLFQRASWAGNLAQMPVNALTRQAQAALLHSGLGQALEEINPSDILDKHSRISRLGEGGIPSIDAVPDEARTVQPSHLGFIDPIRTPESFKAGVDIYLARASLKGSDGRIYAPFKDPRTGEVLHKSPQDVADMAVAFPGELSSPGKRAWVLQKGQIRSIRKKDVDLIVPHFEDAFSPLGNMVPFKSAVKGQRVAMGSRMLTQALPLMQPEAPLVRAGIPGKEGESYESLYGTHMGAMRADQAARVIAVDADHISLQYADGSKESKDLYHNFPYNRKTYLHQTPVVQPGDTVKAGGLLAHSNYTDQQGVTALGLNARVAYLPFRGKNFEDASVISEGMAKRLTSEHMYQERLDKTDEHHLGKSKFMGLFGGKYDNRILGTLDSDGVVLPGTVVQHGEPLILAGRINEQTQNRLHRRGSKTFSDASVVWEHHSSGVVTDVMKGDKGITVLMKATSPMQIGDKLSGRYGDKGVVADIIPDAQMPRDKDGKPFEILLNPNGLISRTNPAQMIEAALGKIAAITGKPYNVADFEGIKDLNEFAIQELQKHGIPDLEDVIDPETDRKIPGVFTGNRFFMKLHHTAESKGQGRGTGGYTMEDTPAKGGPDASKRISMMDVNAILSHGATQVLRDAGQYRGQRNEDYLLAFMQGHTPREPEIPLVYRKFVNQLRSAGINVVSEGTGTHIMAMTNKDVRELAGNREIKNAETVNINQGMQPVTGGLFDPALTGGNNGNRWSYIQLHEAMPNPVMEEPIRRMLGLTRNKFEELLAGREQIAVDGHNMTGPAGIAKALDSMNIDREIATARAQIDKGTQSARDAAIRKLGYMKSAKRLNLHPRDWLLDRVPVLPPVYRPISMMSGTKMPIVADANYLYKELIGANDNLKNMSTQVDDVGDERLAVYHSFKAVTGLGDPLHPKLQEQKVSGVLKHIFGSSPKFGTVQRRLLSSTVDMVGRGVITPNPDFDMDTIGIPEDKAWNVYKPFVIRRLVRKGLPLREAMKSVDDRTSVARAEILNEMGERPVIINRAPVLHRFGFMAFWPKLVQTNTVQVSPLVVKGFNADFDGDAVQYHVPWADKGRREAIDLMMPSKNLISPADFQSPIHMPGQEYVGGLYSATSPADKKQREHRFLTTKDAIAAFTRGEISANTPVLIDHHAH